MALCFGSLRNNDGTFKNKSADSVRMYPFVYSRYFFLIIVVVYSITSAVNLRRYSFYTYAIANHNWSQFAIGHFRMSHPLLCDFFLFLNDNFDNFCRKSPAMMEFY